MEEISLDSNKHSILLHTMFALVSLTNVTSASGLWLVVLLTFGSALF